MSGMRHKLGVDVGGTFTDFVVYDPATRQVEVWKELSTPGDPVTGIIAGFIPAWSAANMRPVDAIRGEVSDLFKSFMNIFKANRIGR